MNFTIETGEILTKPGEIVHGITGVRFNGLTSLDDIERAVMHLRDFGKTIFMEVAPDEGCKDDALRYKTGGSFFHDFDQKKHVKPDPHDFVENAKIGRECAEQLAERAKQEVHSLKNMTHFRDVEAAERQAMRINDLIDGILAQVDTTVEYKVTDDGVNVKIKR